MNDLANNILNHLFLAYNIGKDKKTLEAKMIDDSSRDIVSFLNDFFKFMRQKPYESISYFNPSDEDLSFLHSMLYTSRELLISTDVCGKKHDKGPLLVYSSDPVPLTDSDSRPAGINGGWDVLGRMPGNLDFFYEDDNGPNNIWGFIFAPEKFRSQQDAAGYLFPEKLDEINFRGDMFRFIQRWRGENGIDELTTSFFYAGRFDNGQSHHVYLTSSASQRLFKN